MGNTVLGWTKPCTPPVIKHQMIIGTFSNVKMQANVSNYAKNLKAMHQKQVIYIDLYYLLQARLQQIWSNTPGPIAHLCFSKPPWNALKTVMPQMRLSFPWENLSHLGTPSRHLQQWPHQQNHHLFWSHLMHLALCPQCMDQPEPWSPPKQHRMEQPALAAQVQNILHMANQDPTLQHMISQSTQNHVMNQLITQKQKKSKAACNIQNT